MYTNLPSKTSFLEKLISIDLELLEKEWSQLCSYCDGRLDRSDFLRKPRGIASAPAEFCVRFSLCCREEGCRKRLTPPSVRFFGKRVWTAPVFLIAMILSGDSKKSKVASFCNNLGISPKTLSRWRKWWSEDFIKSDYWMQLKSRLNRVVDEFKVVTSVFSFRPDNLSEDLSVIWFLNLFAIQLF